MRFSKSSVAAFVVGAIALTEAVAGATPVMAQGYPGNYSGPGVANVSVANGNVVIVRGGSGAQVGAAINAPILPGDYIATGPGSRAEVQFDGISTLRLAQNTQVRFVNLSPSSREMLLAAGTVDLAVLQGADGGPQIDTPQLTVRPDQSGDYRVSVLGDGRTLVTARSGSANVASNAGSQTLTPGGTLVAYGPYSNPSISNAASSILRFVRSVRPVARSRSGVRIQLQSLSLSAARRLFELRQLRSVAERAWLRLCLGAEQPKPKQLRALPERSMDFRAKLRLHVGAERAVGLCAVALWHLV